MIEKILLALLAVFAIAIAAVTGLYFRAAHDLEKSRENITKLEKANSDYEKTVSDLGVANAGFRQTLIGQEASITAFKESEARANAAALVAAAAVDATASSNLKFKALTASVAGKNTGCEGIEDIAVAFIEYVYGDQQ